MGTWQRGVHGPPEEDLFADAAGASRQQYPRPATALGKHQRAVDGSVQQRDASDDERTEAEDTERPDARCDRDRDRAVQLAGSILDPAEVERTGEQAARGPGGRCREGE